MNYLQYPLFDSPAIHTFKTALKTCSFNSTDTEEQYKKNLKRLNNNWKYYNEQINYCYNSIGARSPEVSTVDNNNFFITYGCSHTEGIGISEKDRYSNIISKKLNLKYLNYGMGGTSHNYMWLNNILGVKNIKFRPKFVVCQWPEICRVSTLSDYEFELNIPSFASDSTFYRSYIMKPDFYRLQSIGYFHSINQMWNNVGVPVIHFTLDQETHELLNIKKFTINFVDEYNLARDLHHPGYAMNLEFAKYILEELKL